MYSIFVHSSVKWFTWRQVKINERCKYLWMWALVADSLLVFFYELVDSWLVDRIFLLSGCASFLHTELLSQTACKLYIKRRVLLARSALQLFDERDANRTLLGAPTAALGERHTYIAERRRRARLLCRAASCDYQLFVLVPHLRTGADARHVVWETLYALSDARPLRTRCRSARATDTVYTIQCMRC